MLLKLLKKKKVAIVGPSSSLENKNMGKLIDSHDIVIKINRFQDLSDNDYGSRIDILFYNFDFKIYDNLFDYNIKLIINGHEYNNSSKTYPNYKLSKIKYNKIPHYFYPKSIITKDMRKNIIDKGRGYKTTGFYVLFFLLENIGIMKSLSIFGIDFCFHNYNSLYTARAPTFEGTSSKIWPGHDMKNEQLVFRILFREKLEKKQIKLNENIIVYDKIFLNYLLK